MKCQLLTVLLIASVSSGPVGISNKQKSNGSNGLAVGGKVSNVKTPIPRPPVRRPTVRSGENHFSQYSTNSGLGDLLQQIEELNNIAETEGDNLKGMNTFKTTAKGVFQGAKKFYNSPAGQKTRDVVRVLLENNQNSLVNDQDPSSNYSPEELSSSDSLDSGLSESSQLDQSDNLEAQKQEALQDLFMQIDDLNKTLEKEDGEGDNFGVLWGLKKAKQVYDVAKNVKDMIFPKK